MWIDCDYPASVGDRRYLIETLNTSTGAVSFSLRERPLRTNQSLKPTLYGWCGETDNRSRFARGAVAVVRLNKACDRAQVRQLEGAELRAFLEEGGYPQLIPGAS